MVIHYEFNIDGKTVPSDYDVTLSVGLCEEYLLDTYGRGGVDAIDELNLWDSAADALEDNPTFIRWAHEKFLDDALFEVSRKLRKK